MSSGDCLMLMNDGAFLVAGSFSTHLVLYFAKQCYDFLMWLLL